MTHHQTRKTHCPNNHPYTPDNTSSSGTSAKSRSEVRVKTQVKECVVTSGASGL